MQNLDLLDKETCPICGQLFTCSKSMKCWCYEEGIKESVRDKLYEKYDSCVCRDCLKASNKV